jgi:hypothetical protein
VQQFPLQWDRIGDTILFPELVFNLTEQIGAPGLHPVSLPRALFKMLDFKKWGYHGGNTGAGL